MKPLSMKLVQMSDCPLADAEGDIDWASAGFTAQRQCRYGIIRC